jgi:phosphoheptose isomerase
MKNYSKGTTLHKVLGISAITLGVLLLPFVTLQILNTIFDDTSPDFDQEFLNSRYISEDIASDTFEIEEEEISQKNIANEKQGVLKVDENRKVISFSNELSEAEIKEIEETYGVRFLELSNVGKIYVISVDEESSLTSLSDDYSATVETDIPVKIAADSIDWGIARIGADKVWESNNGQGVKVAIIDTGVQIDHPDLRANILAGYDFVNEDSNATDDNGHGTHVAGIVAATLNQAGTVGASPGGKILPVKVLNNQGYGYLSDVVEGIYFATDNGARVINMSLSTTTDSVTLRNAVTYAANKGVLLVAAAGNDGGAPCAYPGAYSSVVCVVATDSNNQLASFSNLGGELAAPGVSNYSTFLGSSYRYLSGTSMASPHVAGSAAILMSACSTCTTTEIREILRNTAVDLGDQGKDILFGYGLVDIFSAVNSLTPQEEEPITQEPTSPTEPSTELKAQNPTSRGTTKQAIRIEEPMPNRGTKYIPSTTEDITVKFSLQPIVADSNLEKIVVSLNNEEVYSTVLQSDSYVVKKDTLDHSQHWLSVSAIFKDGSKSTEKIIIDMTYLKAVSRANVKDKSVLGVSFSIFDWLNIF